MKPVLLGLAATAIIATVILATVFLPQGGPKTAEAMSFGEMTAAEVGGDGYRITPALLSEVYKAFGETEEALIYDGLARVAAGPALEQLYLERLGAMAGGGLEPDQTIHEMELLGLSARSQDDVVSIDAKWRVLGTVGHAEHMHVRGNAYSAALTLEPVEGVWRLTGFRLKDVDRTDAGGLQPKTENPFFDVSGTPTE